MLLAVRRGTGTVEGPPCGCGSNGFPFRLLLRSNILTDQNKCRLASLLLIVLLFACPSSRATQEIMLISANRVLIGADSLWTGNSGPTLGCKINQAGRFFWAASGLAFHDTFSIDRFIVESAEKSGNTSQMLNDAGTRLLPALQKQVRWLKRDQPLAYQRFVLAGAILEVFAARDTGVGIEGYTKTFSLANDVITTAPARTCDMPCGFHTPNAEMRQYITKHPQMWKGGDQVSAINLLLGLAIGGDPLYSAKPISILQVAPDDIRWLQQNNCPDIRRSRRLATKPISRPARP
jgi:hypothetical protein